MTKRNNWRPRKRYNTYKTNSNSYRNGRKTTGYRKGTIVGKNIRDTRIGRPRPIPRETMEIMRKWGPLRNSDHYFRSKI